MTSAQSEIIALAILALVAERGAGKSICPSDVARALAKDDEDWRQFLSAVRRTAQRLARDGQVTILRHGKTIDPDAMRGVIRLTMPTPDPPNPSAPRDGP